MTEPQTATWPWDAKQDDPLTKLRIPVVSSIFPGWYYLVALCINEDPETPWPGLRPTDHEAAIVRSLIDYERSRYNPGWVKRDLDSRPFDIDGGFNGITLIKRGEGDWAFRRHSWQLGPSLIPFTLEGFPETSPPLDLPALCDRIHRIVDAPYHGWVEWKAAHRSVFEPGQCGDPACTAFEWSLHGAFPDIDGSVLVCTTHGLPAPGWAYTEQERRSDA